MSTAPKIDFSPDVFGDKPVDALPESPPVQPQRRLGRTMILVSVGFLVGALLASGIVYFTISQLTISKPNGEQVIGTLEKPVHPPSIEEIVSQGFVTQPAQPMSQTSWCSGDEVVCTTVISSTPAQTLQRLIDATPQSDAKQYKVRLSITPIEPENVDSAASINDMVTGARVK